MQYGYCSHDIQPCTRCPTYNGLVTGCNYVIDGPLAVCEEDDAATFCIAGGLPNVSNYRFTILGPKNTSYESVCGMVGNSQDGCLCLTLTDFPKYPYYPQFITIEAYYSPLGSAYITKTRLKLIDCLNDDPSCREYYNLDNLSIPVDYIDADTDNTTTEPQHTAKLDYDLSLVTQLKIYDMIGRCLFVGSPEDFVYFRQTMQGLIISIGLDEKNQIISINKQFIGK